MKKQLFTLATTFSLVVGFSGCGTEESEDTPTFDASAELVAYYSFDGDSLDKSGNNHDGTVVGATLTTDRHGNINSAYAFDGSSYISVADHDDLDLPNIKTMCVWFASDENGGDPNRVLLNKYKSDTTNEDGYTLVTNQLSTNNEFTAWIKNPQAEVTNEAQESYLFDQNDPNGWHQACMVVESNNSTSLYFDGDKFLSTNAISVSSGNNQPLLIGAGQTEYGMIYNFFDGLIDDVRLYSKSLSSTEIASLYDSEKPNTNPQNTDTTSYATMNVGHMNGADFSAGATTTEWEDQDAYITRWSNNGRYIEGEEYGSGLWYTVTEFDSSYTYVYIYDTGLTDLNAVTSVDVTRWQDYNIGEPSLQTNHVYVSKTRDGYVKFKVLNQNMIDEYDGEIEVEYKYSPTTSF